MLDVIIFSIIGIFGIIGLVKGILKIVFNAIGFILGIILGAKFFYILGDFLVRNYDSFSNNIVLANVVGFLIIFFVVYITFIIFQIIFSKFLSFLHLKWIDNVLGMFLGIILGIVFTSMLLNVYDFIPKSKQAQESYRNSISYKYIRGTLSVMKNIDFNKIKMVETKELEQNIKNKLNKNDKKLNKGEDKK